MADYTINSFTDLHDIVQSYGGSALTAVVYRGEESVGYQLIPKVGRLRGFRSPILDENEERLILRLFKQQAVPYINRLPETEWDWLAIGQHHGLPTRLLDWTRNPLVACYFAVEKEFADDSVIYAYKSNKQIDPTKKVDPFAVTEVSRFIPNHITNRITAQAGIFTIHPDPRIPFVAKTLDRIVIPASLRRDLKKTLYKFGLHASTLFPDLDGLSRHITWLRTDSH
ncbi:MAG TPA: FRG domain-containing protein [Candidatus Saccharimonadales bacterium]|nr:FRG domain-containing protein [Candidatus Saccharimonadales bacterium]